MPLPPPGHSYTCTQRALTRTRSRQCGQEACQPVGVAAADTCLVQLQLYAATPNEEQAVVFQCLRDTCSGCNRYLTNATHDGKGKAVQASMRWIGERKSRPSLGQLPCALFFSGGCKFVLGESNKNRFVKMRGMRLAEAVLAMVAVGLSPAPAFAQTCDPNVRCNFGSPCPGLGWLAFARALIAKYHFSP